MHVIFIGGSLKYFKNLCDLYLEWIFLKESDSQSQIAWVQVLEN